jgi:alpha-1,6-mannosyltransferase
MMCAPPLFSGDGWSYVATGDLAGLGKSPYLWTPSALPLPLRSGVSPEWQFTPSPYGPLPLAWGGWFSHLTQDPWLLLAAYRLAAVLGVVLLAWAVPRLATRVGRDPVDASVLVVASPFVLVHGVGGLHNDVIMIALAVAALAVTGPRRWLAGAVLVGLATAVKAPGLVAVLGVVLLSLDARVGWLARIGRSAQVGGVTGAVVLATGWVTGLGTGWIGALSVPDHEYTVLSLSAVGGKVVRSALRHAGPDGVRMIHEVHPEIFAKRLGVVVLLLVGGWVLLRTRLGSPRHAVAAAGAVLLLAVVLSPVVHYWYFLWCVPVLACVPLRRSAGAALVAAIGMLGLTAVADHALGIRWLWEGGAWGLVLVPALVLAVTTLRDRGRPVDVAVPDPVTASPADRAV